MSILLNTQTPIADISIDAMVKEEQRKADTHFRVTKRFDNLATVILWTAAGLTLAILVYILGFIVYKGFRSDNVIETSYIDRGTIESPLKWYPGESVMIANRDIRLKEICYCDLEDLLKGKPSNWGNINEQDLKVTPYVLKSAEGEFGKNTTYKSSVEEILNAVENHEGAFGLIPVSEAAKY